MTNLTLSVSDVKDLNALEALETEIHRARQGLINFKALAIKVMDSGEMTHADFLILDAAALASPDFNDSLTLNKMTILFALNEQPLH